MATQSGIEQAVERFYSALSEAFKGNLEPMRQVWSHDSIVTDMGPFGGREVGWAEVEDEFDDESQLEMGGKIEPRELLIRELGDIAYATCYEEGVNMTAARQAIRVRHRATSIFRKENGEWKLIHHHTDVSSRLIASTSAVEKIGRKAA